MNWLPGLFTCTPEVLSAFLSRNDIDSSYDLRRSLADLGENYEDNNNV